jgi:hypothetical protein
MATLMHAKVRPQISDDYGATSKQRTIGVGVALVGMALAVITLIANLSAAGDESIRSTVLPWSFGLTTTAFAVVKTAIVVILWGILMKIWTRVDAIKAALSRIVTVDLGATFADGEYESAYGRAVVGHTEPAELPIHKMAKRMWAPMAAMGLMAVVIGSFTSFAWAGGGGIVSSSWTQGLQFLGEGMLLASISFVLGTILWAIRTGGSEVQSSLGVAVKTLKMPVTAKVFVGLMMLGLMAAVTQFVLYLVVAGGGVTGVAAWQTWLGPLRELALALILSGIALALVTIGNVLSFQFDRITELIRTGK